jgi:hypothetical protein
MTVTLTANDTCDTLFAAHPEAVYTNIYDDGTEQLINVMVPCTGAAACYTITRDSACPGRYTISLWPDGFMGEIEPGTEPPGEITDILTDGIPLRRGARS